MVPVDADLVLEGGGVKGIGLVGAISSLERAGYRFHRVAGTSAGAVVGALVAAGMPAAEMHSLLGTLDYRQLADRGFLDRLGPIGKGLSVIFEKGVFEGERMRAWVADRLDALGVRTFSDLRVTDDPESSLPRDQHYRLVVTVADVSAGRLVRLPWDYSLYGLDPDAQPVADAVRASASIPFMYEPATIRDRASGRRHLLVDGGLLSNFPVDTFDRTDGRRPRWPTFGVKLSARPDSGGISPIGNTYEYLRALVGTMVNFHDQMHLDDPCVVARTIFVDTLDVRATDFDIDSATQEALFHNGVEAAEWFLARWDFEAHLRNCRGMRS